MTKYEELLIEYENEVSVIEMNTKTKGLYCDKNICVSTRLISADKHTVLAEELGHYHTSTGNILNQNNPLNQKQERAARVWGYQKVIPLDRLVEAYYKSSTFDEVCETLDVSLEYLADVLEYYEGKYGNNFEYEKHVIVKFRPLYIKKNR